MQSGGCCAQITVRGTFALSSILVCRKRDDFSYSDFLCRPDASHPCFSSIQLTVCEEMSFEEFQEGRYDGHLGY